RRRRRRLTVLAVQTLGQIRQIGRVVILLGLESRSLIPRDLSGGILSGPQTIVEPILGVVQELLEVVFLVLLLFREAVQNILQEGIIQVLHHVVANAVTKGVKDIS